MTRGRLAAVALVFACFAAYALWRSPLPGVNEPQYLCKAKHFYAPDWCARDLFLNSANAHWVFYALIGPFTQALSLDQTAWVGRLVVWAGLAYAWVRLAGSLLPGKMSPVWSACLFLALQAAGNLSGEWLIGGVEAKGFSYIALFLAIVAALERSYRRAAIELGLAVSLHPVVGVWGAAGLAAAIASRFTREFVSARSPAVPVSQGDSKSPNATHRVARGGIVRLVGVPCALCLVFSLPGLIPALAMMARAPSKSAAHRADVIQVFERLDHHLDPTDFSRSSYLMYAGLLAAWLTMTFAADRTESQQFFTRFVLATLAMTLAGFVAGIGFRNPWLMKFYPFRLFDLFLPIAVSISAVGLLERAGPAGAPAGALMGRTLAAIAGPGVGIVSLFIALLASGRELNPSNMQHQQNWLAFVDACKWIEGNTPRDALFLTLRMNVGFKWYAQRAEYVTWKDCPQDAAGILEWKGRLELIGDWREAYSSAGFTRAEFAALAKRTGIDFALAWNSEPWEMAPVYRNRSFSVYRLAK